MTLSTLDPLDKNAEYDGKAGAEILADRIRAYWAKRGHRPRVVVTRRHAGSRGFANDQHFDVRSDMQNGRPL